MSDLLMRAAAFALLAGFLAILIWHVPRLDLGAVILLTLACVGYDLFLYRRRR